MKLSLPPAHLLTSLRPNASSSPFKSPNLLYFTDSHLYRLFPGHSENLCALLPGPRPLSVLEESLLRPLVWVSSTASGAAPLSSWPPLARCRGHVRKPAPSLLHSVSDIQPSHDHIKIHDRDVWDSWRVIILPLPVYFNTAILNWLKSSSPLIMTQSRNSLWLQDKVWSCRPFWPPVSGLLLFSLS